MKTTSAGTSWFATAALLGLVAAANGSRTQTDPARPRQDIQRSTSEPEVIEVDRRAPTRPFPHYWERMFGSGRAILSLRDSYRRDLRQVRAATGFEYVRFHA